MAVRGVCVCVSGGCDVIFNITEGVRTNFFVVLEGGGVLSKLLLDNSRFSVPPS